MRVTAEKRFMALVLSAILLLALLPISVFAAQLFTTTVLDGKIQISGDGTSGLGTGNNSNGIVTVTAKAESSTCITGTTYTASSHTVTILNATNDETLVLSFAYEATGFGAFTIAGVNKADVPKSTYNATLAPGASIVIVLTSKEDATEANLVLSAFALQDSDTKTVTVNPSANGTISVNGTAITAATTLETTFLDGFSISATAASGYKFIAWVDADHNVLSSTASATINPKSDISVSALFLSLSDTTAHWMAGGKLYSDFAQAMTQAAAVDGFAVLLNNATLPAGTYTIPAGVKVLIPFDDANTHYGEEPELMPNGTKWVDPTVYRSLTLASGAMLEINGALEVAAKHHISSGSSSITFGGAIYGKYGYVNLADGAEINVNNGGKLYAWGIINGGGTVTAVSGASVYEKLQVNDYRGGTMTTAIAISNKAKKFFPFSQYYCQNIECKEIINAGAILYAHCGVFASEPEADCVEFVGGTSAMFGMSAGAYVVKQYDAVNDRLVIDLYGNAGLNPISLSFNGQEINSADYNLGINNNITINIHSGITTINQRLLLQPGVKVYVAKEAALYNASTVYVMDAEDWGTYCRATSLMPIKWTAANGTTVKRTAAGLTDAVVDVNGTVISAGQIFTSGTQSVISSEGTGVYILNANATASTTTQMLTTNSHSYTIISSSDWKTIDYTAAVLVNGDTTTVTASGAQYDTYIYDTLSDAWTVKSIGSGYVANVTYDPNGGAGTAYTVPVDYFGAFTNASNSGFTSMAQLSFPVDENSFTNSEGTFLGWSTDPDAREAEVAPNEYITVAGDTTLYAVWRNNNHTVTWIVDGQTYSSSTVADGAYPEVPADPVKAEDAGYTYTFLGWDLDGDGETDDVVAATGNDVYTAVFAKTAKQFTITWVDGNGDVIYTEQVDYGTVPVYDGDVPVKDGDAQYSYYFNEIWSPEIVAVTGNATYTAQFVQQTNKYTVTWVDGNGDVIYTEQVDYGTVPVYDGDVPVKDGDAQYSYYFNETWSPEIVAVTGNATYTAQFVSALNEYTVTWVVDGNVTTQTYKYGETPAFGGSTDKAADAQYTYTFIGWDSEIVAVTGDITYTAQYESALNEYTVTWVVDGNVTTQTYKYGETPAFGGSTDKAADAQYTYTFIGWDSEIVAVTGDVTYTAQYESALNEYTVTWVVDGNVTTQTYKYGETPAFGGSTDKAADAQYTYTFIGWDSEIVAVTGDVTYTAQYESALNEYTVTWVVDGNVTTQTYKYGETPAFGGSTDKAADAQYTYTFIGWDSEIVAVTGDITYTAQYEATEIVVDVVYGDIDGNGTFDGNDLVLARQVDATAIEIDQAFLDAIEVSGDGIFDGADVVLMVQMDAGAISQWPR